MGDNLRYYMQVYEAIYSVKDLQEQVVELEKKVKWLEDEIEDLRNWQAYMRDRDD